MAEKEDLGQTVQMVWIYTVPYLPYIIGHCTTFPRSGSAGSWQTL